MSTFHFVPTKLSIVKGLCFALQFDFFIFSKLSGHISNTIDVTLRSPSIIRILQFKGSEFIYTVCFFFLSSSPHSLNVMSCPAIHPSFYLGFNRTRYQKIYRLSYYSLTYSWNILFGISVRKNLTFFVFCKKAHLSKTVLLCKYRYKDYKQFQMQHMKPKFRTKRKFNNSSHCFFFPSLMSYCTVCILLIALLHTCWCSTHLEGPHSRLLLKLLLLMQNFVKASTNSKCLSCAHLAAFWKKCGRQK